MLGHYRVIDELGKGGMGFVFRAEDVKLKRTVALKVMNQKIASTPNSRRRFIHEARAMAAVHHDNVATIFEVGESKGTPFMAMEMLKGSTLEEFNRDSDQLGFEKIIDFARQIARGLAAAHGNGIVHRDIKPANIWLETDKDRIKILDFGLALASTPVDHLAGRGAVIGTPGYLSPEQARSEPLDDRSDLYSLGVVLYELCTGQLPIQSKSVPGQLISILAHRPQPIGEINPDIPQPLCDLVHKLLRKEPRSRHSSAIQLEEDLNHVEQECHAKSEVAQAINKLQMGLSEVVSKKEDSIFETVDEYSDTIPDPLAAIPVPTPVAMMPPARPVTKKAPAPAPPAWQSYWPIAAIVAVVLIALPLLTFAFSGWGRSNVAHVVEQPRNDLSNAGTSSTPKPTQQPAPGKNDYAGGAGNPNATNSATNNAPPAAARNQPNAGGQNSGAANNPTPNKKTQNQGNKKKRNANQRKTDSAPAKNSDPVMAAVAASPSSEPSPPDEPKIQTAPPPSEPPPEPPVQMERTTIATSQGRGADAMVQSGSKDKLGLNPSIGIRRRGGKETNHSYLRFDLAPVEDVKKHIESAELVLTVVGGKHPVGAEIRVIGIPDVGEWPEDRIEWRYSYSDTGLEAYPLLAETTVRGETGAAGKNEIRLSSAELVQFIAGTPGDTVTLALAGAGPGSSMLRFVSREQSAEEAPRLVIEAPAEAPPDEKKKGQRR